MGQSGGWALSFLRPGPQSICQRNQEREHWPLFPYAPPGSPAGDPEEFSLRGALGMRQVRVQAIFLLGLGETSSFVSHPSYKTCGFLVLLREARTICSFSLLYNLLFPLTAIFGWQWALLVCLACMRKSGCEFTPRKISSQFISSQKQPFVVS